MKRDNWTKSRWKKEADKVFSRYIRRKYADKNGNVSCITCGVTKHWKEMDCGHYISRNHLSTTKYSIADYIDMIDKYSDALVGLDMRTQNNER